LILKIFENIYPALDGYNNDKQASLGGEFSTNITLQTHIYKTTLIKTTSTMNTQENTKKSTQQDMY